MMIKQVVAAATVGFALIAAPMTYASTVKKAPAAHVLKKSTTAAKSTLHKPVTGAAKATLVKAAHKPKIAGKTAIAKTSTKKPATIASKTTKKPGTSGLAKQGTAGWKHHPTV